MKPWRRAPSAGPGARRAAFRVLRHRDYRQLLIATSISSLGARFQFLAVLWWVYDLTDSGVALGFLSLVRFLPVLIFGLFGGVIADRYDRRTTLIVSQTLLMATSSSLAALAWTGSVTLPAIFTLAAITALIDCVAQPARSALIPALVPNEEMADAMSVNIMVGQTASIAGPALAGVVIAAFGTATAFTVDAAGFVVAIGFLLSIRTTAAVARTVGGTWTAALEGLAFLRRSPVLLSVMSVDFFATFLGATTVLLPIVAVERLDLGADGLGLLNSSIAVGALAGSIVVSLLPSFDRPGRSVLVAVAVFGLAIIGLGLSTTLIVALAFLALSGAADAVSMALRHTVRNMVTPDALRGRISAAHSTFASGGPHLGDARAGVMVGVLGSGPALVIGGIGVVATVVVAHLRVPTLARTTMREFVTAASEVQESSVRMREPIGEPPPAATVRSVAQTTASNVR